MKRRMNRMMLIDRDALKKSFCENCMLNIELSVCSENGVKNCIVQEIIDNAPTIDAEPVRHGRGEESPFEYCPHCGAKMEDI